MDSSLLWIAEDLGQIPVLGQGAYIYSFQPQYLYWYMQSILRTLSVDSVSVDNISIAVWIVHCFR
jgi:hypothetical protein